jgi:GTP-binding protein HflX
MKSVILVQRNEPRSNESENSDKLFELEELAKSAGYCIVGEITQSKNPDRRYQVGRGKVDELASLVNEYNAEKVIFYNQLSTIQIYNVSETCKCEVIDKFHLILEIFATRATTKRAKLQVELAQLEYELPKAKNIVSLLKQEERPGFMSLGEYEDSYEQDIKNRISRIKNELKTAKKDRESLRKFRHDKGFSLVALAGYTNAGKSTLFNTIVDEDVRVEDMLFTTLSPVTRSLNLGGRHVLLTDTVGFIEDLPHWMIDAFRSTLDEIFLTDVILLVVDVTEDAEKIRKKLATSHEILWDKSEGAPIITVLNKVDAIKSDELNKKLANIEYLSPNPVFISAKSGYGLDNLKKQISQQVPGWKRTSVSLPMSDDGMAAVSWLFEEGVVHNIDYGDYIEVDLEARDEIIHKAQIYEREIFVD